MAEKPELSLPGFATSFVSTWLMKLDRKGRVSVPSSFRAVLKADGFQGLYCIPTPDRQALDCGGHGLINSLQQKLAGLDATSQDYDLLATALYGESDMLTIDSDGRILLPERLIALAMLNKEATFVGKGNRFQIWQPERYQAYRDKALERAQVLLWGGASNKTHQKEPADIQASKGES
jgi:MraZ protein